MRDTPEQFPCVHGATWFGYTVCTKLERYFKLRVAFPWRDRYSWRGSDDLVFPRREYITHRHVPVQVGGNRSSYRGGSLAPGPGRLEVTLGPGSAGTRRKAYENVVELAGYKGEKKIMSRRERPHVVFDRQGIPLGLTNGVPEAWPCTLQVEPDRPACKHATPPGVNPTCGPGSNGTSILCPDDYSYTLFQRFQQ